MPTWTNQLPPEGKHMGFDLRRTPASAPMQAAVTSDDLLVCDTHFFHGRTMPCERLTNADGKTIDQSPCPACREQIPWRTHAYVSAFDCKRREHFIFECTAQAAKAFAEYRQATLTLRGCAFQASRPKGQKNSKVAIITNTLNLAKNPLPQPPNLTRALSVIWRLPLPALETEQTKHRPTRIKTRNAALDAIREQGDNQSDPQSIGEIIAGNGHLQHATT